MRQAVQTKQLAENPGVYLVGLAAGFGDQLDLGGVDNRDLCPEIDQKIINPGRLVASLDRYGQTSTQVRPQPLAEYAGLGRNLAGGPCSDISADVSRGSY